RLSRLSAVSGFIIQFQAVGLLAIRSGFNAEWYYTNHMKYLISSEPHSHLNPRRIGVEMEVNATREWDVYEAS
ncbi:hypothetical protein, partial [Shewanella scandinavica]|uniref:hypothetical protein n=1 Tax=Shewanella scandinavica TaxID=3063538 RepID=UPI00318A036F